MKTKELIQELDTGQESNSETGFVLSEHVPIRVEIPPHTYEGEITGFWRDGDNPIACFTVKNATLRIDSDYDIEKIDKE